jgi:hypothetical protein
MTVVSSADRKSLQERKAALDRFNAWAERNPMRLTPADAVAAAGRLYDLLPSAARTRPIDCAGIMTLHRLLTRIDRAR